MMSLLEDFNVGYRLRKADARGLSCFMDLLQVESESSPDSLLEYLLGSSEDEH